MKQIILLAILFSSCEKKICIECYNQSQPIEYCKGTLEYIHVSEGFSTLRNNGVTLVKDSVYTISKPNRPTYRCKFPV